MVHDVACFHLESNKTMRTFKHYLAEAFLSSYDVKYNHPMTQMLGRMYPNVKSPMVYDASDDQAGVHFRFIHFDRDGRHEVHFTDAAQDGTMPHLSGSMAKVKVPVKVYGTVVGLYKKALAKGKPIRIQAPDERTHSMYKKMVSRLIERDPDGKNYEMRDAEPEYEANNRMKVPTTYVTRKPSEKGSFFASKANVDEASPS